MARGTRKADAQKCRITRAASKNIPFFRAYADLLRDPVFNELSPMTRLIYIEMGAESGKNIDDFTFPKSLYRDRYSFTTFVNAVKELEKHGFIKATRYYKQPTHYALSSDWMRSPPES